MEVSFEKCYDGDVELRGKSDFSLGTDPKNSLPIFCAIERWSELFPGFAFPLMPILPESMAYPFAVTRGRHFE